MLSLGYGTRDEPRSCPGSGKGNKVCVPLSALVKYVAVCVRVCWYCHQTGGTDVVDLPDILLPAGQYLDMFDSESETDVPSDSSDEELVEV